MSDTAQAWRDLLKKIDGTLADLDALRADMGESDPEEMSAFLEALEQCLRRDRAHVVAKAGSVDNDPH